MINQLNSGDTHQLSRSQSSKLLENQNYAKNEVRVWSSVGDGSRSSASDKSISGRLRSACKAVRCQAPKGLSTLLSRYNRPAVFCCCCSVAAVVVLVAADAAVAAVVNVVECCCHCCCCCDVFCGIQAKCFAPRPSQRLCVLDDRIRRTCPAFEIFLASK